jgi:hypothetical protein
MPPTSKDVGGIVFASKPNYTQFEISTSTQAKSIGARRPGGAFLRRCSSDMHPFHFQS